MAQTVKVLKVLRRLGNIIVVVGMMIALNFVDDTLSPITEAFGFI
jgi:hypothetical protein